MWKLANLQEDFATYIFHAPCNESRNELTKLCYFISIYVDSLTQIPINIDESTPQWTSARRATVLDQSIERCPMSVSRLYGAVMGAIALDSGHDTLTADGACDVETATLILRRSTFGSS